MSHPNARLTRYGRLQIIHLRGQGYSQAVIAHVMGVSRATVCKWIRRYLLEGPEGLVDRSSRPESSPHVLAPSAVAAICALRRERAWGPHRISYALGIARSTVYAVLRRAGLHRLASLHRSTREVIRYERAAPGELVHLDVKKLGRIPDGGGKRFDPGFLESGAGRHRPGRLGCDYIHVAVDDYSRYAYAEALPDERGDTTAAFLVRALTTFQEQGVRVQRLLTDNGGNYRSHVFAAVASQHGVQLRRTRPYRPQTNGKAEAFNKTLQREWAYVRLYTSNDERTAALASFLAEYNADRPHTALGGLSPL
ncbi:MAG: IS481 family transposase, partial [Chloroflexi bacterium]|nr:IS481 family transposase [Chloroflexota bacterium]